MDGTVQSIPGVRQLLLAMVFGVTWLMPGAAQAAECGNGIIEVTEACDDGNLVGSDGCSAACTVEQACYDPGDSFSFFTWGDSYGSTSGVKDLFADAVDATKYPDRIIPRFWLSVGDIPFMDTSLSLLDELNDEISNGAGGSNLPFTCDASNGRFPYFVAIGNHDIDGYLHTTPEAQYDYWSNQLGPTLNSTLVGIKNFSEGPSNGHDNRTTYSFDYKNAHFVVVNQYHGDPDYPTSAPNACIRDDMLAWLEQDLSQTDKPFKFVFGHAPAWSYCSAVPGYGGTTYCPVGSTDNLDPGYRPRPHDPGGASWSNPYGRHWWVDWNNCDPGNRDAYWALLDEHNVMAHYVGHTHTYSTRLVEGDGTRRNDIPAYSKTGQQYSDTEGTWEIDHGQAHNSSGIVYMLTTVSGDTVTFRSYDRVGNSDPFRLIETFSVELAAIAAPQLLSPLPDQTFAAPGAIPVVVDADVPPLRTVGQVEIFIDQNLEATLTSAPYEYTITGVALGNHQIHAVVTDDQNLSFATPLVDVSVVPNEPPLLTVPSDQWTYDGQALADTVGGSDPEGGAVSFNLVTGPTGATLDAATGEFNWTPDSSQHGQHVITVSVTDDHSAPETTTGSFVVTVYDSNYINEAPVATTPDMSVSEQTLLSYYLVASDPNGDVLSYALVGDAPASITLDAVTGLLEWTPDEAAGPGSYPIAVQISDNGTPVMSVTTNFVITVTEANLSPVIASITEVVGIANTPLSFNIPASDADLPNNTLSYDLIGPAGMTINSTGDLNWVASNLDIGLHPVTVTVTDDGVPNLTAEATFNVRVTSGGGVQAFLQAVDGLLVMEAEHFETQGGSASEPWATLSGDTTASNLELIKAGASGGNSNSQSSAPWVELVANFNQTGPHQLWVRARALNGGTDSLYGALDNETWQVRHMSGSETSSYNNWIWLRFSAPLGIDNTGVHAIRLYRRERYLEIDKVVITPDTGFTPVGTGPLESLRGDDANTNWPPSQVPIGDLQIDEGDSLNIPLLASDPNTADLLSFGLTPSVPWITLTDNGDGSGNLLLEPLPGDAGTVSMTLTVTDNGDPVLSVSETFDITVVANVAPVLANPGNQTVAEGGSLNIAIAATDGNAGDLLALQVSPALSFASFTDNGDGTGNLLVTPGLGDAGSVPVTVTVVDDGAPGLGDSISFTLTVTANTAPIPAVTGNQTVLEGESLVIALSATDVDVSDVLSFNVSPALAFMSLTDNGDGTGSLAVNPGFSDAGDTTITVTVTDSGYPNLSNSANFLLTVVENGSANSPPVLGAIGDQALREGETLTLSLSATDVDANGLGFAASALSYASLTDNGNGTASLILTPQVGDAGADAITVTVTDDGSPALSDSEVINVTVAANAAPVVSTVADQDLLEGGSVTVTVSATDAEGDALQLSLTPALSFAVLTDNGDGTGTLVLDPQVGDAGTSTVTLTATDDGVPNRSDSTVFTITVTAPPSEDAFQPDAAGMLVMEAEHFVDSGGTASEPWAVITDGTSSNSEAVKAGESGGNTSNQTTSAWVDYPVQVNQAGLYQVWIRVRMFDGGSDSVFISMDGNTWQARHLSGAETSSYGQWIWLKVHFPIAIDTVGEHRLTLHRRERRSEVDKLILTTDVGFVPTGTGPAESPRGTGNETNAAPSLQLVGAQVLNEGDSLNIPLLASDPNTADLLSFGLTPSVPWITLTDNGDGSGNLLLEPLPGDAGTVSMTLTVTDNGDPVLSVSETFDITVVANVAPVLANPGNQTVAEGGSLNIAIAATDGNAGDLLALQVSPALSFASFTDNGDGTGNLLVTPGLGDAGSVPVTVTVVDDGAPGLGDSISFTLTVTANTAPIPAVTGNQTVLEGESLVIALSATDVDVSDVLSFNVSPALAFMSLTDNGDGTGSLAVNPGFSDAGDTTITVTVTDSGYPNLSNSANFLLTVVENGSANSPPVLGAIGDQALREGETLTLSLSATDVDANGLGFAASALSYASLTDNGNGTASLILTPQVGDAGADAITVTVTDDGSPALSDSEVINVTVAANAAPVVSTVADQDLLEGGSVTVTVSATDAEGDALQLSLTPALSFAVLTDNGDGTGTLVLDPQVGDAGTSTVTLTATDDGVPNRSDSTVFTITVTAPPSEDAFQPDAAGMLVMEAEHFVDSGGTASEPWAVITDGTSSNSEAVKAGESNGIASQATAPWVDYPVQVDQPGVHQIWIRVKMSDGASDSVFVSMDGNTWQARHLSGTETSSYGQWIWLRLHFPINLDTVGEHRLTLHRRERRAEVDKIILTPDVNFVPTGTGPVESARGTGDPNIAPVPDAITDQNVLEGASLAIALSATDADAGDVLSFSVTPALSFMSLTDNGDGTGSLAVNPGFSDAGDTTITVTVTDSGSPNLSNSVSFLLTVAENGTANSAPVLNAIGDQAVREGETLTLSLSATDVDANGLGFAVSALSYASLTDNGDGTASLTLAPQVGDASTDAITVTVTDDGSPALSDSEVVNVTVAANAAPVVSAVADQTLFEGGSVTVTVSATDTEGGVLQLSLSPALPFAVFTDNGDGTGTLVLDPQPGDAGTNSLTVTATDDGVPNRSGTATFSVTVNVPSPTGAFQPDAAHMVVMEAEHFAGSGGTASQPWAVITDGTSSNTEAVKAGESNGIASQTTAPWVDYPVQVNQPGVYQVWIRVRMFDGASDSVFISMDGNTWQARHLSGIETSSYNQWIWLRVHFPISIDTVGEHALTLHRRERRSEVDKLILTPDVGFVPTGTGPAESLRQ